MTDRDSGGEGSMTGGSKFEVGPMKSYFTN